MLAAPTVSLATMAMQSRLNCTEGWTTSETIPYSQPVVAPESDSPRRWDGPGANVIKVLGHCSAWERLFLREKRL